MVERNFYFQGSTGTGLWQFNGQYQQFVVPDGVTNITVEVDGAPSLYNAGSLKVNGGRVGGRLNVIPGETLTIGVGGQGAMAKFGGQGGWPGGGNSPAGASGLRGGGGSGYSAIWRGSTLLCLGAGAGGCTIIGTAGSGTLAEVRGGAGGDDQGEDGDGDYAGGGGSQHSGGLVSTAPDVGGSATKGSGLHGGAGLGNSVTVRYAGGGGGAGYYGGGGGAWQRTTGFQASGGGGGSNYVGQLIAPKDGDITNDQGGSSQARVQITYFAPPDPPLVQEPPNGSTFSREETIEFSWLFSDADTGDTQQQADFQWRVQGNTGWHTVNIPNDTMNLLLTGTTFPSNTTIEWQVRTQDETDLWGKYSPVRTFLVTGSSTPPKLISPINSEAVEVDQPVTFTWQFRDPDPGDHQTRADLRYRAQGADDLSWITFSGDATTPGSNQFWTFPPNTIDPGITYEWQVFTYDTISDSTTGQWSQSGFFASIAGVGAQTQNPVVALPVPAGTLGCGTYRVMIYDRGGKKHIGEITNVAQLQWSRVRDDVSNFTLTSADLGSDGGDFYGSLRSMRHEIVLFRDMGNGYQRVWEGPITRLGYFTDHIELEARDVMQYVYRRIMRQNYNDSYPNLQSVVFRASRIIINALAIEDPNVLPYLTRVVYSDDAQESRVRAPYSSTAWEEVDDMAATAGLDYTIVGRRIILWDTHRPIGRLPMMRDGDFSEAPVVTEYGMDLATTVAVTNNSGVWGRAINGIGDHYYGVVEMLLSAYGEQTSNADEAALTPDSLAALQATLESQAQRNAAGRYPAPVQVRVPDNSSIHPDAAVDINYLVPGVWIPLQSTATPRKLTQVQKLDNLTVLFDSTGEKVQVTMSPAPEPYDDPDSQPPEDGG